MAWFARSTQAVLPPTTSLGDQINLVTHFVKAWNPESMWQLYPGMATLAAKMGVVMPSYEGTPKPMDGDYTAFQAFHAERAAKIAQGCRPTLETGLLRFKGLEPRDAIEQFGTEGLKIPDLATAVQFGVVSADVANEFLARIASAVTYVDIAEKDRDLKHNMKVALTLDGISAMIGALMLCGGMPGGIAFAAASVGLTIYSFVIRDRRNRIAIFRDRQLEAAQALLKYAKPVVEAPKPTDSVPPATT